MRRLAAFVFPGFQTLDYFGPVEMLGGFFDDIELVTVGIDNAPVSSRHGQKVLPDCSMGASTYYDLLLVPGGDAALDVAKDPKVTEWIHTVSEQAERMMGVCTGSILLGISGVLDGKRATTNKLDFTATVPLAPGVDWVKEARWVQDGKFFTSSGVSAGMDMALGVAADLFGLEKAREMAEGCEYAWHEDPTVDPFAAGAGLV